MKCFRKHIKSLQILGTCFVELFHNQFNTEGKKRVQSDIILHGLAFISLDFGVSAQLALSVVNKFSMDYELYYILPSISREKKREFMR